MAVWAQAADHVAGLVSVACVIAVSAVVMMSIVSYLVFGIALRAMEKTSPDQMPQLIVALAQMIGSFSWIWPWRLKERPTLGKENSSGLASGGDDDEA